MGATDGNTTTNTNQATTTDDTAAGAADTSTETTGKPASDEGAASSAATDKGDDQATQGDDSGGQGGNEGAGDSASQDDAAKSRADKAKQNREAARLRLTQKNEKIPELRSRLQTEFVDEAEDDKDRQIREIQAERYVEKVERVNEQLQRDNEAAAREIDLFNPSSESFSKDLLDRSLKRYARDCLTVDQNGVVTAYTIPLLDYLREEADGYGYGSKTRTPQQKAADSAKMDAAADAPGGASAAAADAKQTGKETFDDAFLAGMEDPYARHKPKDAHTFSTGS